MMIEVKICENCGHNNGVTAVECEKCGYDLTFVFPQKINPDAKVPDSTDITTESKKCDESGWQLTLLTDDSQSFPINGTIEVGRDCDVFNAYFNSSNFTSRVHAKLRLSDNGIQVMDASTNGTFVDEKRIEKMEWIDVKEGSTLRFADVSFRITKK